MQPSLSVEVRCCARKQCLMSFIGVETVRHLKKMLEGSALAELFFDFGIYCIKGR